MRTSEIETLSAFVQGLIESHPTIQDGNHHAVRVRGLRDSLFDALDLLDQTFEPLPDDPQLDVLQHVVFVLSTRLQQGHPDEYVSGYMEGIGELRRRRSS